MADQRDYQVGTQGSPGQRITQASQDALSGLISPPVKAAKPSAWSGLLNAVADALAKPQAPAAAPPPTKSWSEMTPAEKGAAIQNSTSHFFSQPQK